MLCSVIYSHVQSLVDIVSMMAACHVPPLRVMLKGGVLGCVSLPVLALLALLRGRSGKGPLNVLLRFLASESAHNHSKSCVTSPASRNRQSEMHSQIP